MARARGLQKAPLGVLSGTAAYSRARVSSALRRRRSTMGRQQFSFRRPSMRALLVVAFVIVLGVGGHSAPGVKRSSDQTGPAAECAQDFPSAASPDPRATVVVCLLDNPRGLTFGPEGALYVAEAGRGGTSPCIGTGTMTFCYGPSGAVSRLWHGTVERLITGLPSLARFSNDFRTT